MVGTGWAVCLLVLFVGAAGCGQAPDEVAVIQTSIGDIVVAFHGDVPGHVDNFKKLARQGFYDGTAFHRVKPGGLIQGGCPNTRGSDRSNDGIGGPGYTLPAEFGHKHIRGAVAAARLPDEANPNRESSGSQFYICLKPAPHLDNGYTVFGYVVEGLDVALQASQVHRDERDNPLRRVAINTVSIEQRELKYRRRR
ncbi:MAG: peptidylprolyl isomerase [Candidatus Latescibacteria bacterium]|jgi:cyclophilin family peptidyl-prolyl cis-trans isomerase|nr:peptidylprolyl isomerase [Candidatus Latescibacterota bacterium]